MTCEQNSAFLLSGLHFHIYVIYVCPTCASHQAILEAAMALGKASGPTAVRSNAFVKTIHNMFLLFWANLGKLF